MLGGGNQARISCSERCTQHHAVLALRLMVGAGCIGGPCAVGTNELRSDGWCMMDHAAAKVCLGQWLIKGS